MLIMTIIVPSPSPLMGSWKPNGPVLIDPLTVFVGRHATAGRSAKNAPKNHPAMEEKLKMWRFFAAISTPPTNLLYLKKSN